MMENETGEERRERVFPSEQKEPRVSFKAVNWKRLFSYLKPYRGQMVLALLSLACSSGLGLAFPLVIVRLLDSVTRAASLAPLNNLALALVGLFVLQASFSFAQSYILAYIGEHIVYDLRTSLYNHLVNLSLEFFAIRRVGDIVSRLSSDVTQMRTMLTNNLASLLNQVLVLFGSLVIILTLNARLTVFILILVPALLAIGFYFGNRIEKTSTHIQDQLAASTVVAEEGLQGIRVIKSFGREPYESQRYDTAMDKTFRASLRLALYNSIFGSVLALLGFISIAAFVWYGGREVIAGRLTLALITGFIIYGITIAASLGGIAGLYGQLRAAVGGVLRVFEIMDTKPSVLDEPTAAALPATQGRITFEEVSFSYEDGVQVIHGISLDIQPGEILALVGPSGAGKSTIFNLIPRFYDPTNGIIRIDGKDLRSLTQESLRMQMAIVPQETILFGGTIRENILYGRLDASDEDMIAAARAANAHEFIAQFPQGYETIVGERGTRLSGGQRQRISIARAILKDPRILLLDEATSSLDSESEKSVQEALDRLMQNRTTVIIAHRLSTIKVAHRIAVLEAGCIIELGTHEELMRKNGLYAHLYAMQFRNPEEELAALVAAADKQVEEEKADEKTASLIDVILRRNL